MSPRAPIKRTWDLPRLQLRQLGLGLLCALRLRKEYLPESGWHGDILMLVSDTKYVVNYTTRKTRTIRAWVVYAVDVLNSEIRRGDLIGLEITRLYFTSDIIQ